MTSSIEVRRYTTVEQYQVDAATMAAAGWTPVSQTETSGGANGSWVGVAAIVAVIAILLFPPLLLGSLVFLILAYLGRSKVLVVTYRPEVLLRT